jgi:HEAT repeat protein
MDTQAAYLDGLIAATGRINALLPSLNLSVHLEAIYVPPCLRFEDGDALPATLPRAPETTPDGSEQTRQWQEEAAFYAAAPSIDSLWEIHPYWCVLGAPGAGKRALLRQQAIHAAYQVQSQTDSNLPLWFEWPAFVAAWQSQPDWDSSKALQNYLHLISALAVENLLHARRALLLGESLDGVEKDWQGRCIEALEALLQTYPGNRCLLSAGENLPLPPLIRRVYVQAFTPAQTQHFFQRWCKASASEAETSFDTLWLQIKNRPDLHDGLNSPFLCLLAGIVHAQGKALPDLPIALYPQYLHDALGQKASVSGFSDDQALLHCLEDIALFMQRHGHNAISVTQIDTVAGAHGAALNTWLSQNNTLFGACANGFSFRHALFQEYLAARALVRNEDSFAEILAAHCFATRWRGVIRFAAAYQGAHSESSGSAFIKRLQNCTHPHDPALYYSFRLTFQAMLASRVSFQLADHMFHTWMHLYQQQPHLRPALIRLLRNHARPRYKPAAITPLLDALKAADSSVRIDAAEALGCLQDHNSLPLLLDLLKQDAYPLVRAKAAEVLGEFAVAEAMPALLAGLRNDNALLVRRQCALALAQTDRAQVVQGLLLDLKDRDATLRWRAAEALAYLKEHSALPLLLDLLRTDEVAGVRWRVAEALAQFHHDHTLPALRQALAQDPDLNVRSRAAEALGYFPASSSLEALQHALKNDKFPAVRWRAAEALGRQHDARALPSLLDALRKDMDNAVRWSAAEALGKLRDKSALPLLLGSLREDFDVSVRWSAAEALGFIGDSSAVPTLLLALKHDGFTSVRAKICQALGRLRDVSATPALLRVLASDVGALARRHAAEALGCLGDSMALPALLAQLSQDNDAGVRWSAAAALAHFKEPAVIAALLRCLDKESDVSVRQRAAHSLELLDMGGVI